MGHYEDRADIIDLTHRYCWALDTNQWHELDDVFLPDATAQLGTHECKDLDQIKRVCSNALGKLDDSQHIVATHQVAVHGDTATSRCYLHAQHVRRSASQGPHYIVGGRYEDDLVRTTAGWRIKRRILTVMWTEGNPGAVRGD